MSKLQAKGFALDIPMCAARTSQREQNPRYAAHNGVRFFADCAAKKGLLSEQQKSGLKDIGSVLPLTPEKCG